MTPDLERLRSSLPKLEEIVEALELELVDEPNWAEPSDASYLNDEDKANPDIMANVEAMAATNELISWFARDMEGYVGLWRGPENTPLEKAPVVRLDTEGVYEIVAATIPDYIAISVDEDDFKATRKALTKAGFTVAASTDDIWAKVEENEGPSDHRHALYNEARKRRGLPEI